MHLIECSESILVMASSSNGGLLLEASLLGSVKAFVSSGMDLKVQPEMCVK